MTHRLTRKPRHASALAQRRIDHARAEADAARLAQVTLARHTLAYERLQRQYPRLAPSELHRLAGSILREGVRLFGDLRVPA